MERTNNNFNLFDFDVEGFAQAYYQQSRAGQQSGNTREQASFEQQMNELQLNSSDESSATSSSPDESPAKGDGGLRRTDFGGSVRMPPHSRLRDTSFSSTRHSVDIPRAHFRDSAQVPPQSNLRDDLFSSARYTLPSEEQPAIQTKNSKDRGLWSRIKSGVGKAFGTSRSEKPSGSTAQQEVFSTKFRVDYAKQPGRTRGVPEEDEELFEDFKSKAKVTRDDGTGKVLGDGTIKNAIADLRHLSGRLSQNRRPSIADRIGNPELEAGLDDDVETYAKDRSGRIKAALKKLRDVGAGKALSADIRRSAPYPADATLIDMWAAAEKATRRIEPETVDRQARRLSRLSDWLQTREKGAMAGRLNDNGLAQDVEEYRNQTADTKINADLLRLRRYQQVLEANRALGLPPPESARPLAGEGARQPGSPQELPATPATPSEGAWDWFRNQMQEPASSTFTPHHGPQPSSLQELPATPATPSAGAWDWFREQMQEPASSSFTPHRGPQPRSLQELPATPATPSAGAWDWFREQMQEPSSLSSARRPSSDVYGGLEPLVNLNPPTPDELRDDAHSVPAPDLARPPSFVGSSGAPQERLDIGSIVGEGWHHGSQPASDVLIDVLSNINLMPNQFGPSQFAINGEHYSATFGPGEHRDVRLIHHPRARPMNEAGPSRQPIADLGFLIRGGWQHRERWLPPYLVRALEGEHLLPEAGRPTYINIRGVPYRAELLETDGGSRVRVYPEAG
ncbi:MULTISPECIES: hypothetical protein [unclassified Bradyrhizobium]|uniref:hypothetical protein n=1 Tax=unclassified Bradyrhizobium TaxID=2631580 RepID=UPI00201B38B3|nr:MULTISPECIES: hypothetical protein [unclassified Bradyrhizobium]WOH52898.1 hypothetical protein RX328_12890 [Bradyrhizobium sp. sBnM-33]